LAGSNPIVVVGGGPAGALAAANLARAGRKAILFDEKLAWEKPCGGGITHKALEQWPFLADAQVQRNWINHCELIAPSGRSAKFDLDRPIAVFSRQVLNGLLLQSARQAGAEVVQGRVVRIEKQVNFWRVSSQTDIVNAASIILAAGARSTFRKQFSRPFASTDLMATAGYYIPGRSNLMQIRFLPGLYGYVWLFPRVDHLSAGICGKLQSQTTADLRTLLEECLREQGIDFRSGAFYSHVLPALSIAAFRQTTVSGDGWAMIGDAVGLVDPITGEGLYYALRSAELLSQALIAERPHAYPTLLRNEVLTELETAAGEASRFYSGRWMGQPVLERMIQFSADSATFRAVMRDIFAGRQSYRHLRRRLYCALPTILVQTLFDSLCLPATKLRVKFQTALSD
jgi:flavin-dependent dehydrogenase